MQYAILQYDISHALGVSRKLLTSHPKGQCSMNTERQIVLATTDVLCFARNLPQNRLKCLRRTFCLRGKIALYDALK